MTWILASICVSIGLIAGILTGLLLMYGIITKTLGKEGRKNLEDAEKKHREYLESAATGHEIMERNGAAIERIAEAIASASSQHTDLDMVLLPRALTAENGAKAHLIGEFYEKVDLQCPECLGLGENRDAGKCEICGGSGSLIQDVPVSWATIKAIYAKVVEHYGK